ncbi:MAG TPA: metal-dependent hydrolase [Candidatus Paceibacterota bacterium]|nr:metal-dependent hydrolase [Candidatus Paceibacterota bacterium]
MAYAVTHILIPIILIAIYRDFFYFKKHKKKFSIHYVYFAGFGGIIPDIDILFDLVISNFGFSYESIHRTFTHSLFIPLIFIFLYFILKDYKVEMLGKHKLKLSNIFLALALGTIIHIILDILLKGYVLLLSPFSMQEFGLNLINYLPSDIGWMALPIIDWLLLIFFLAYLEIKHKISDFV